MFTLDIVEAKSIMSDIVKEFGETHVNESVDSTCWYFHPETGVPSCGVGQLFARKGVTADMLSTSDNHSAIGCLLDTRKDEGKPFCQMDDRTVDFLRTFQYAQDARASWGEALARGLQSDAEIFGE